MVCDLCGGGGQLYQARVEGTVMTICESCKGYGEVLKRLPTASEEKEAAKRDAREERMSSTSTTNTFSHSARAEVLLLVTPGYARVIKNGREHLGLKQEELAKKLRLKESQLHKYETGAKKPDLETARLLEKALRVTLVEEHTEKHGVRQERTANGPLTLGDLMKKK